MARKLTATRKRRQARRNRQPVRIGFGWIKPTLALITVLGSAAGLTLMLEWMKDPHQWPVGRVNIQGEFRHLQSPQLEQVVAPLAESGFFVVNVGELQRHLQALAWVEQVSVRRVWPDELEIEVREQRPVAHWGSDGFLNARAQVFRPERAVEADPLPWLSGPDGYQERVLAMYRSMQTLLQPLQLEVARLSLDARRAWRVELDNGLVLEAGRGHPLQRMARFIKVYPALLAGAEGRLLSVDLRYSNGFAARWQEPLNEAEHTG
jgi:cell division protein FtsQ